MTTTNRIEECEFPQVPPVNRPDLGIAGANPQDLVAVLQSAQSLTSTIELDELIHQLHQTILQNSGAQTCMLALPDREDRWQIHSRSVSGAASISTLSQHLDDSIEYPANLIHWVKNTQQPISCNARQPLEIPDRYLRSHQPQSVLALPIVKQDRVLGVVYLEHQYTPDLFTDNHKAVISFLCNQAAIAIDNANRYQESLVVAENLRLQQSYLEALLNNIPHMAWLKDRDSRFIAVNRACAAVVGCEPIDLVGKTDLDIWPKELANAYRHDDFAVMACGERKVVEERSCTTAGEPCWLETMKMPMRNSEGEITGTVGIALDITDRKLSEISLRQSEERYHQIVSNIPAALYQVELTENNTHKLNFASARFSELFDLDSATAISDINLLFALVVPEDRDSFARSLNYKAIPWRWEGRILTPAGKLKWIRGESDATTTAQGKIVWDGILLDITEAKREEVVRKQAETALRASEARYHRLADNIPGAIYQLRMAPDGSLSYPYISSGCWELFELSPAAVMADANSLFQQLHPDDRPESYRTIAESARSLAPKTVEGRSVLKSGKIKWIKSISRPERQPDGAIVWDGMMFDITERQEIEIALRASEDRYHQLVSNVPGALYQFELTADGTSRLNYVSTRFYQLLEISPTEDIEDISIWFDRVAPEDLESFMQSFQDSAKLGQPWEWEGKWLMPSGQIKWIRGESTQQKRANGSIVWDGMLIDITDRKQVEMELLASKQFLQTVLDTFPLHVFWKDRQSRYLGCNQQFAIAAGVSASKLVGKNDYDLPWERAETERFRADDLEVITTETPKLGIIETQLQADGNCYWLETNKVPLRNPNGETIGVLGTFQNVTDREQAQIALRLTNERLELTILELQRATRLKDEFLATMSHELRTPLNAILGMSEALHEQVFGSLNQQQLKSIETIERGGRHLLSLINDILDVSKISAGKLELDISAVSMAHLCNSSLAFVRQQALQKQIQLDLQLSPVPVNIAVDERRMRQVTINLLGNAVKFTPPGGRVVLSVSQQQTDDRWDWELAVTDTGIGIAPQDLDRLFQPFVQLDSRLNRQYEGTGLGLTLVKQIVELHGGKISIRSELDRGSCFTVKIPYVCMLSGAGYDRDLDADPSTGNLQPLDLETISAPLLLLAEDNAANINTLSSYLKAKGYRTMLATTGLEAIDLLQAAANDPPALILMDIQMPEMDGLEAIDRIRNHLHLTSIPIIALTALAMPGDREKCLAAGANEYLTKPVQLKQLAATIQQLLRASE
jgi:PAS domain S-box-containing protein